MKDFINYIKDIFTGTNGTVGVVSAAIFTWCFGEFEIGLQVLVSFMIADYIMGLICGRKENNLSSEIGFKGLKKKFTILIILTVAVLLDRLLGQGWVFRTLVIYFYIGIEGLSIMENAARLNAPIPEALKNALIQLKEGNKKASKKEEN
ncbi:phage holin family protein [Clostridium algidicarnis]|uniref:phage holin family protein n=1 Tax=Clostridium algidicarnis TaxID=37659 RepID=UPI001C0BD325|nr:phage holin family protein [Clostridium algidicarnis]MBU3205113.1 phage holin family protein [Clostridium algidicarnis]MBU3208677.1 phage holin family protein [Clostridium algidicarnis]MBU3213266.1 phage holin family protein [Clostridium algidicarnis]MBU3223839.1 phage holin family protein [Clostridium algidicarnis]